MNGERAPKPALVKQAEHGRRRMDEGPILLPEQPPGQVLCTHEHPRQRVARRVAEHEQPPGSCRCRSQQAHVVRVTADDSVQHDDVGCLYAVGLHRDVVEATLRTVLERQLAQQPLRFFLIRRGKLEVRGASSAAFQELCRRVGMELDVDVAY